MLDPTFYQTLLTFSAVGFTVFISGAIGRYTILKDTHVYRWFFKIFVNLLPLLAIPGAMLALSPIFILFGFMTANMNYALIGFYVIFFAYVSAACFMIFGFIIGYAYLISEDYFYKKFRKRLKKGNTPDFLQILVH
jgi:hypothetical protein